MEIIFVIAAATGRTLVLPPETTLYRLGADKKDKFRGFADFFPFTTPAFAKHVPVISMEEFLQKEGAEGGRITIPEASRANIMRAAEHCEKREKSDRSCMGIFAFLNTTGFVPEFRAKDYCIIFDQDAYEGKGEASSETKEVIKKFCGERKAFMWGKELDDPVLMHIDAGMKELRLLTHFYAMIRFTDQAIDHYFKRFVRDFLHYHDSIYCAAGKIVKAVQAEALANGAVLDNEGGGGFGAMHVRRGDFQFKVVKIPAEEWLENTKEVWKKNEIIYIATDERNKTFFDPIAAEYPIRFLDDYWEMAGLANLDPNYMGMIDTIVASRARAFAGTWFSTFSGYINRMRGLHGLSMKDSWYSFLDRKTKMHTWDDETYGLYAFEFPDAWIGIDGDSWPSKDKF